MHETPVSRSLREGRSSCSTRQRLEARAATLRDALREERGRRAALRTSQAETVATDHMEAVDARVLQRATGLEQASIDRHRAELRMVEDALARIEAGEYGVCLRCGRDISPERLEALPATQLCVNCQSKTESGND